MSQPTHTDENPRNPGTELDLDWALAVQANTSAIERRCKALPGRRSIKKTNQAAWLLKAITCIDLTTLSGDDTEDRVRRLCRKARFPVRADLLEALERSAREGGIVLQCEGVVLEEGEGRSVVLQFDGVHEGGSYLTLGGKRRVVTREQLVKSAAEGTFVGTITGRHGANDDYDHPQPALWTRGSLHAQVGKQRFPSLHGDERTMLLGARHVREGAAVIVNGRRVPASLSFPGKDRLTMFSNAVVTSRNFVKLSKVFACFRLYRHRSLQVNTRFSAFFKIYQII